MEEKASSSCKPFFSSPMGNSLLRDDLVLFNMKVLLFRNDDAPVDSFFQVDHRLLLFLFEDASNIGIHVD
jgi:hypothetical protein